MLSTLLRLGLALLASCSALCAQSYNWTTFAGRPPQPGVATGAVRDARFFRPWGIVSTNIGLTFISDATADCIYIVLPDDTVSLLTGSTVRGGLDGPGRDARFAAPAGLVFTNNYLFVADRYNHAIRRVSSTGETTTFAGRLGTSGSADGTGGAARFNEPTGLAVDREGNLYVADSGNHTLRKITPTGEVSTLVGTAGASGTTNGTGNAARFTGPTGLAFDGVGNLYVSDTFNHAIRRVRLSDALVTTFAGSPGVSGSLDGSVSTARFNAPQGLVADSEGIVMVADTNNDCIRIITPTGGVVTYAGRLNIQGSQDGPRTEARFFSPSAVCFAPGGFYITDTGNYSIRKIAAPNYDVTTLAGPGGNFGRRDGVGPEALFNYLTGIAVHSSGDLYVSDSRGATIRRISPDRTVTTLVAGGEEFHVDGPADVARVNAPFGVAVAPDRTVYFCEYQRHTVRKLSPDGTLTTIAGFPGLPGSADGSGTAARFFSPSGVALDKDGNLYIADYGNSTIRRIAAGTTTVTTFAGSAGSLGAIDDTGTSARFRFAAGIATDADGNVYVADTGNHTIRKITPAGVVSTIAGRAGTIGSTNGAGASARFNSPSALFVTAANDLLVCDSANQTVRRIAADVVSTIGGEVGRGAFWDGVGNRAWLYAPSGIVADSSGTIFITEAGNNIVRRGELVGAPVIVAQPQSLTVFAGSSVVLSVNATGIGLTYQWSRDGQPITGATSATYTITNVSATNAGRYTVTVTNASGSVPSSAAIITLAAPGDAGRIVNLSILSAIAEPGDSFTMGFVVGGAGATGRKPLVIRAAGPSLGALGVPGTLADPKLELFFGATAMGSNDNWGGSAALAAAMRAVGAFAYTGPTSADAAIAADFSLGNNSAKISASGSGTGAVIAEIYDATPSDAFSATTPRLVNVSVLKHLGTGLTAGFAIGGNAAKTVLIRAIGPTLSVPPFGVPGVVADPQLTLFSGSTQIGYNDNWGGSTALAGTFTQIGAFPLSPASKDAVLQATLAPGTYTVVVSGVGGTTGTALIEIYEVGP